MPRDGVFGRVIANKRDAPAKDFLRKLRFARLWRGDADPLTVSINEVVQDGDIVELHL